MAATAREYADRLVSRLRRLESCAVALSGGVDSAVVAKAAFLALGERAIAITAESPSVPRQDLADARRVAQAIGIRHETLATHEFDSSDYVQNAPDRCFHCKSELYSRMAAELARWGVAAIANGANAEDWGDWRPGLKAADHFAVVSPLADCGLDKAAVRELARYWDLPVSEKPASPCLSSRVAYGQEVTPERLAMIEAAELFLREIGFSVARVRYHEGDLARVELPAQELARAADPDLRRSLVDRFKRLGFAFVSLDLEGFRSGSMNRVIPVESLISDGGK